MFRLSIVTPEKVVYDADIRSLVVPGVDGYLGVLSQHAPLITALKPGKIEFRDSDNSTHFLAVSNGFLEVSNNIATLLADAAEDADDIDVERARKALERAESNLAAVYRGELDADAAEIRAAMERAHNRIRIFDSTH
ncbi:MAG: F0F1 ATP synthase subunit epsilon [Candidatus Zixiibacteriota bacterium]|nr:MAG: F0F1 ATP synthase subunit epsilon [candidate division Zixibacteria bacterium]